MTAGDASRRLDRLNRTYWALAAVLAIGVAAVGVMAAAGVAGPGVLSLQTAVMGIAVASGVTVVVVAGMLVALHGTFRAEEEAALEREAAIGDQTHQEVEGIAQATRARVDAAEDEIAKVIADVRREADAAIRALRSEVRDEAFQYETMYQTIREVQKAFTEYVDTHRHVHEVLDQALAFETGEIENLASRIEPKPFEAAREPPDEVEAAIEAMEQEAEAGPDLPHAVYSGGDDTPVRELSGISDQQARALDKMGIHTTAQLCGADAAEVAKRLKTWPNLVRNWQAMAELTAVKGVGPRYAEVLRNAGVEGIDDLSQADPEAIAARIEAAEEGGGDGHRASARRARAWVEEARRIVQP